MTRVKINSLAQIEADHKIKEMAADIAKEALKRMEPYAPEESGKLIGSGRASGKQITYSSPYAKRWYYKPAHFSGAPKRGNFWFERMKNEGGARAIAQTIAGKYGVKSK